MIKIDRFKLGCEMRWKVLGGRGKKEMQVVWMGGGDMGACSGIMYEGRRERVKKGKGEVKRMRELSTEGVTMRGEAGMEASVAASVEASVAKSKAAVRCDNVMCAKVENRDVGM